MKTTMMAVLLMGMLALTGLASADTYKTIYNPFTSKLDYVTSAFTNLTVNGTLTVIGNASASWFFGKFNWTENSPYLDFTGGYLLSFNETKLNATIDARERDTFWNITGSTYLYNNSGVLEVNETRLNSTINSTAGLDFVRKVGDTMTGELNATEFKGNLNASYVQNEYWVNTTGDRMTGNLTLASGVCIAWEGGGAICSAP